MFCANRILESRRQERSRDRVGTLAARLEPAAGQRRPHLTCCGSDDALHTKLPRCRLPLTGRAARCTASLQARLHCMMDRDR